jgi:membrane protease YdiL (CAAX protease family)
MIGFATLSALPLHEVALSWILPLLGIERHAGHTSKLVIYASATIGRVAILYTMGIAGLRWAKLVGIAPMPLANRVELAIRTDEAMAGIKPGLWCTLISVLLAVSQVLVFGSKHAVSSTALARHEAARTRMEGLISWRSVAYVCAGAPIQEEILFRLFLFSGLACPVQGLIKRGNQTSSKVPIWSAIVMSGLVFGLFHVLAGQSVAWWRPIYLQLFLDPRTYIGMVLAWVYWKRGIETSFIAHSTLNVAVFVPISVLLWVAQPG